MKNKTYLLNVLLAAVTFGALLVCLLVRTFAPAVNLPVLDIPNMTALSVAALILNSFLEPKAGGNRILRAVLAALTFGLLPLAAGFAGPGEAVKLALVGAAVFTAAAELFGSMEKRMASGGIGKVSLVIGGFGLYLAAQCFAGWI